MAGTLSWKKQLSSYFLFLVIVVKFLWESMVRIYRSTIYPGWSWSKLSQYILLWTPKPSAIIAISGTMLGSRCVPSVKVFLLKFLKKLPRLPPSSNALHAPLKMISQIRFVWHARLSSILKWMKRKLASTVVLKFLRDSTPSIQLIVCCRCSWSRKRKKKEKLMRKCWSDRVKKNLVDIVLCYILRNYWVITTFIVPKNQNRL